MEQDKQEIKMDLTGSSFDEDISDQSPTKGINSYKIIM